MPELLLSATEVFQDIGHAGVATVVHWILPATSLVVVSGSMAGEIVKTCG